MTEEPRTSDAWAHLLRDGVIVFDPDGWDRKNFHESWFEEKITKQEFEHRFIMSTVQMPREGGIWKLPERP